MVIVFIYVSSNSNVKYYFLCDRTFFGSKCIEIVLMSKERKKNKNKLIILMIWFHDFWLAPLNKDIDKIGRPPM